MADQKIKICFNIFRIHRRQKQQNLRHVLLLLFSIAKRNIAWIGDKKPMK